MIHICNLHDDIGYDMYLRKRQGVEHPFALHVDKLLAGGITHTSVACYFEGDEDWAQMQEEIMLAKQELDKYRSNFPESPITPILTVEGMGGIKDQAADKIRWLHEQGVRMASLTWNDENELATGVAGHVCRGVTALGQEALSEMSRLGMILDVSHLNEMSFWQVIEHFSGQMVASHSNAKALCDVERNLTNQQIQAIASRGGVIGMNAIRRFVSPQEALQTAYGLALHARHIKEIAGVAAIAIGFDYMDYYDGMQDLMILDMSDASYSQQFMEALAQVGLTLEDIHLIAYGNAMRLFASATQAA